jgi:hypothetical protein
MLNKQDLTHCNTKFYQLKATEDYVSLDMMVPLKDEDGNFVYLDKPCSYAKGQGIKIVNHGKMIPFTDAQGHMKRMYEMAATVNVSMHKTIPECSTSSNKAQTTVQTTHRGVLLLDITNNRVYANGNVFEKAKLVQDGLFMCCGQRIVVIVYVGSGIFVRRKPKIRSFARLEKDAKISDVIQDIDEDDELGLDTPVFVFGFSKMNRGMSFRSKLRVPTHIIASRGMGYSFEEVIQTLGRATFCGKGQLEKNGFQQVTLLCTQADMVSCRKYTVLMDHVQTRMDRGDNLIEIFQGKDEKIPDNANPFRHADRKVGQGSKHRAPAKSIMKEYELLLKSAFDDPMGADPYQKERYWNDVPAQRLLGVIHHLWRNKAKPFEMSDLQEAYLDDLGTSIKQAVARKYLTDFCTFGLLCKEKALRVESKEVFVWSVPFPSVLNDMVNPNFSDYVG